jgi:hypothetical protein
VLRYIVALPAQTPAKTPVKNRWRRKTNKTLQETTPSRDAPIDGNRREGEGEKERVLVG